MFDKLRQPVEDFIQDNKIEDCLILVTDGNNVTCGHSFPSGIKLFVQACEKDTMLKSAVMTVATHFMKEDEGLYKLVQNKVDEK